MSRPIDADELVKVIENLLYEPDSVQYVWSSDVLNAIRSAPTVQLAPVVHGKWVKMTGMMPPEYHGHYECSECGWHMKGIRNSWTREEELSFCPGCGAKIDGEEA